MAGPRVLIVEDEFLIALGVEAALLEAGYVVCGVAATEAEALELARTDHPNLAIVDVRLAPGDGRLVARELAERFHTTVLMATSESPANLHGYGATAVVPKPYDASIIPSALRAAQELALGDTPVALPVGMQPLNRK